MYKFIIIFLLALSASAAERPNILYIFTDDQSYRTVGCYPGSYDWVKTPNIDKLAEGGIRFNNAYMAPFCVASRITHMTGNLPHSAQGTFKEASPLTGTALEEEIRKFPFWLQTLRDSGYHTGMVGKWHIYSRMPTIGVDWDYAAYWHKKIVNAYYYGQKVSINGAKPVELGGYSADRQTDLAINYVNQRSNEKKKPWYMWLCYSGVHMPHDPAKRHLDMYNGDLNIPVPVGYTDSREGKPKYVQQLKQIHKDKDHVKLREKIKKYNRCVLSIDENVGRIVETLKKNGQYDNTIIIFGSDQGLAMGHHGFNHKKNAPYGETLRSPLIFHFPKKFPQGKASDEHVSGPDVIQTIHELTGIQAKDHMDGNSFVDILKNPQAKQNRPPMLMSNVRTSFSSATPKGARGIQKKVDNGALGYDGMPMYMMIVVNNRYKYVRHLLKDTVEEVYDLKSDPNESRNLAMSKEYETLLKDLRGQCVEEFRKTQSGFEGGHFVDLFPKPSTEK